MRTPWIPWYIDDWLGGTVGYSFECKGAYAELLFAQVAHGHLTKTMVEHMLGTCFSRVWPVIECKFSVDSEGKLFNERMDVEIAKRLAYINSRKNNGSHKKHMHQHMQEHMQSICTHMDVDVDVDVSSKALEAKDKATPHARSIISVPANAAKYSASAISQIVEEWRIAMVGLDPKFTLTQEERLRSEVIVDGLLNSGPYTVGDLRAASVRAREEGLYYKSWKAIEKYVRTGIARGET